MLGYILEDKARKYFDKTFFYFEDKKFTYSETNQFANRVANGYLSLGMRKGDKVIVMLPNCAEFVFNWFGCAKLGVVESPINPALLGDVLRHVILITNAKALLIHEDFIDRIKSLQDELTCVEKVIIYSPSGKKPKSELKFPTILFDEFVDQSSEFSAPEEIHYYDPLQIIYTSGTTGPSKGAVLPHHAMYVYAMDTIESFGFKSDDIHFSALPLFHINIRYFTIVSALLNDTTFAMVERFSVKKFWDQVRKYNATNFTLLGAMITFILNQPPSEKDKDNSVRTFQGGPMTTE